MVAAHANISFLNISKGCSHVMVHIFTLEDDPDPRLNEPILTIAQIIKFSISSVVESELAGLFITTKVMAPLHNILIRINWPQPKLSIQTDKSTAAGFTNSTIVPKCIKSMGMRFHWLYCRVSQDQYRYYWGLGSSNMTDYSTKHRPDVFDKSHYAIHAG